MWTKHFATYTCGWSLKTVRNVLCLWSHLNTRTKSQLRLEAPEYVWLRVKGNGVVAQLIGTRPGDATDQDTESE